MESAGDESYPAGGVRLNEFADAGLVEVEFAHECAADADVGAVAHIGAVDVLYGGRVSIMNKAAKIVTIVVGIVTLLVIFAGAIGAYGSLAYRQSQTEAAVEKNNAELFVLREEQAHTIAAIRRDLSEMQVTMGRLEERLIALQATLDRRPPPRQFQGRTPEP